MNSKSKVKLTAKEILDLVSMKKLQLHEAIACLKQAKKQLQGRDDTLAETYETR